jgi:thiol-disulfide isomerase/thioredoxin
MTAFQTTAQTTLKARLTKTSVVRDSSGLVYPYEKWAALTLSGDYQVSAINYHDENSEFILRQLTLEQKIKRAERISKPIESKFFTTGEKISSFKAKDMSGKRYTLKDLVGKVVVLNFWFIGCPPCRMEIPELNKVVEQYKDNSDVIFLAIALDDYYSIKEFVKRAPYNYNIIDGGRYIAEKYGIHLFPTHVVLDRTGTVRFHTSGYGAGTIAWLKKTIDLSVAEKAE